MTGKTMIDTWYLSAVERNQAAVSELARAIGVGLELGQFASPLGWGRSAGLSGTGTREGAVTPPPTGVIVHGPFIDLHPGSPDPRINALTGKRFEETLAVASDIGATKVVFHTGYNPMVRGPGRLEAWVQRAADFWRELLARHTTSIVVENVWEPGPEPMLLLARKVNHPRFGLCLDTGHLNVFSRAGLGEWASALAPHLRHLHLNDNHGEWDEEIAVGDGTFDFGAFFEALARALGRDGAAPAGLTATVEVDSVEGQEKSLRRLAAPGVRDQEPAEKRIEDQPRGWRSR